jgi:general secretion pathway protein F
MPVFEYKGFDARGGAVAGVIDADSAKVARVRLRKQGLFPTDLKEQTGAAVQGTGWNREIHARAVPGVRHRARCFSNVTAAGSRCSSTRRCRSAEALAALVDQTEKSKLRVSCCPRSARR